MNQWLQPCSGLSVAIWLKVFVYFFVYFRKCHCVHLFLRCATLLSNGWPGCCSAGFSPPRVFPLGAVSSRPPASGFGLLRIRDWSRPETLLRRQWRRTRGRRKTPLIIGSKPLNSFYENLGIVGKLSVFCFTFFCTRASPINTVFWIDNENQGIFAKYQMWIQ